MSLTDSVSRGFEKPDPESMFVDMSEKLNVEAGMHACVCMCSENGQRFWRYRNIAQRVPRTWFSHEDNPDEGNVQIAVLKSIALALQLQNVRPSGSLFITFSWLPRDAVCNALP